MGQMPKESQEFNKVAECLYRNGNRLYYAIVKVNGKQIGRSLKTNDLAIAKRRLVEFSAKAERLEGGENRNIRFEELADEWLASVKSGLKPKPFFRGMAVKSIGFAEIDAWKRKRGATVSARSHDIKLETLKIILRSAVDRGIVLDNAATKFKRRKQPKSMIELPSHAKFRALVKSLREARWQSCLARQRWWNFSPTDGCAWARLVRCDSRTWIWKSETC